jgi:HAD superfamily hydrolase (TIGR01549 family)
VRAVVFDLGNTLWFEGHRPDMGAVEREQAQSVRRALSGRRSLTLEQIEAINREIWDAYLAMWRVADEGSYAEPSLPALIRDAALARGIELLPEEAESWHRARWIGARRFGWQLYPDALDVLSELRRLGVRVAINSNRPCTSDIMLTDLDEYGIARYVDAAVCSGDTGFLKPHPSTFVRVLRDLGVAPHEAAMVGDSCRHDLGGAKAVGMRTIWKLNGRYDASLCKHADYAIHELGELLRLPIIDRGPRPVLRTESLTPHEDDNEDRY